MVMAAMSDYRIVFEESFRFEGLISSLRLPEADPNDFTGSGTHSSEDDGAWDARTSSMVLINALTNGPELLEERILLREEFSRRGLNEVVVVSVNCFVTISLPSYCMPDLALHKAARRINNTVRRLHGREI